MNARDRIPAGPIDQSPGGFIPEVEQRELLLATVSGVELGDYDRRILDWLARWDAPTVLTVASLLRRAYLAGRRDVMAEGLAEARVQGAAGELERLAQRTDPGPLRTALVDRARELRRGVQPLELEEQRRRERGERR